MPGYLSINIYIKGQTVQYGTFLHLCYKMELQLFLT